MSINDDTEFENTELGEGERTDLTSTFDLSDSKSIYRHMVSSVYQLQNLRIGTGNRVVAAWKAAHVGQTPSKAEKDLDKEDQNTLKILRESYDRITDAIVGRYEDKNSRRVSRAKFKPDAIITSFAEYSMVGTYLSLLKNEELASRDIEELIKQDPMWVYFFDGVKGCGPRMAAVCMSFFRIDESRGRHPSNFHAYAGIDVVTHYTDDNGELVECNEGRGSRKHHLVQREYINKDGETATKTSLSHNRFVKRCLVGVLSTCFIKAKNPKYYPSYLNYKERLKHMPQHAEKTPAHIEMMARRRMIKQFLTDLHRAMCDAEGFTRSTSYAEGMLNRKHLQPRPDMGQPSFPTEPEKTAARHQRFLDGLSYWDEPENMLA